MPRPWVPVPITTELFENVDPVQIHQDLNALENCFVTEVGTHSRFPGLGDFVDLKEATSAIPVEEG